MAASSPMAGAGPVPDFVTLIETPDGVVSSAKAGRLTPPAAAAAAAEIPKPAASWRNSVLDFCADSDVVLERDRGAGETNAAAGTITQRRRMQAAFISDGFFDDDVCSVLFVFVLSSGVACLGGVNQTFDCTSADRFGGRLHGGGGARRRTSPHKPQLS